MRTLIAVAALLVASASQAAAPAPYALRTAGDLANLCATPSTDAGATSALAFCHGFLAGAYSYFQAVTPAADRFVCAPDPAPTRTVVANGFVAWMKTHPQLANDGAADTLFRYAAEAYPCKR